MAVKNVAAKSWTLATSFDGRKYSGWPGGDKPNNVYVSNDTAYDALYTEALEANTPASTLYVATTGNDTTGNGSSGNPYLTIKKALQSAVGGSHIIVRDGTYTGITNWISTTQVAIPSGTAEARTIIRAENRFGVRITQTVAPTAYSDAPIKLNGCSYVWVDGFIIESTFTASTGDGNDDCLVDYTGATHCRATRLIGKRKSCDQYGSTFMYGNQNVFEDCHHFGSSRYAFYGGTGGSLSPAGSSVLRRCVSYMPFGAVLEPTASFSFYGANDGTYAQVKDMLFANCIEIDSPHLPHKEGQNAEDLKWGSWYHPKSVRNVRHVGCGIVNGGGEYGAFTTDNYAAGDQALASFDDCFVAGFDNGSPSFALAVRKASSFGSLTINHFTASGAPGGAFPPAEWTGANNLTADIVYPLMRVDGDGADVRYAVGVFLSEYGDEGYDEVQTTMPLWPWPYESYMADVFAESITRVTQDVPVDVAASADPFTGSSLAGNPMTFTRRVWESLGTVTPSFETGAGVY